LKKHVEKQEENPRKMRKKKIAKACGRRRLKKDQNEQEQDETTMKIRWAN
jgi:hypothetical protein